MTKCVVLKQIIGKKKSKTCCWGKDWNKTNDTGPGATMSSVLKLVAQCVYRYLRVVQNPTILEQRESFTNLI